MTTEQKADGHIDGTQSIRSVLMPSKEDMAASLKELELVRNAPGKKEFYDLLVKYLAGRTINAGILSATWNSARDNVIRNTPVGMEPISCESIDSDFSEVINALTPDREITLEAIRIKNKIAENERKTLEAKKL